MVVRGRPGIPTLGVTLAINFGSRLSGHPHVCSTTLVSKVFLHFAIYQMRSSLDYLEKLIDTGTVVSAGEHMGRI